MPDVPRKEVRKGKGKSHVNEAILGKSVAYCDRGRGAVRVCHLLVGAGAAVMEAAEGTGAVQGMVAAVMGAVAVMEAAGAFAEAEVFMRARWSCGQQLSWSRWSS